VFRADTNWICGGQHLFSSDSEYLTKRVGGRKPDQSVSGGDGQGKAGDDFVHVMCREGGVERRLAVPGAGIFTFVVVSGLGEKVTDSEGRVKSFESADANGDGIVTVGELTQYVVKYDPGYTKNQQVHQVSRSNFDPRMPLSVIRKPSGCLPWRETVELPSEPVPRGAAQHVGENEYPLSQDQPEAKRRTMRSQLTLFLSFLVLTILATFLYVQLVPRSADVLYVGARIYTVDKANTVVEGIAIRGDRIVAVGSSADMVKEFRAKRVIDLTGKTVVPGLIDAHVHLLSLGVTRLTLDLVGTKSEDQIAALVRQRVATSEPGQWIRGRGWDQNEWKSRQFPSRDLLDRVAPNNPVYLIRVDGHAAWVNKMALEIAGVTRETRDPEGGRFMRDAQGNPTGVLIDNAMEIVGRFLPPPSDKEMEAAIDRAVQECLSYGLTCVHDMGVEERGVETYKRLIDEGRFPFRVCAALAAPGETWERYSGPDSSGAKKGPLNGYGQDKLWVRAIKLYIDGALGSRGAALTEPYSDDPNNRGLTVMSEADLRKAVDEALANGFQVCTHAIGDRGNNIVLNVYEAALQAHAAKDPRLRIEHAQVLAPNDIPRFHKLGVIPSMQPTHCTADMYWAEARLGPTRVRGAYAWRSLLNTGVIIPGGSDFPVEGPNPLFGIYAAITRQDRRGMPRNAEDVRASFQLSAAGVTDKAAFADGWYVSQKMTREEALRAFTSWAAFAGFQEDLLGSLEQGKLADFVVLSKDIMNIPPLEILKTTVERTILGGKEVYQREQVSMRSGSPGTGF
jgi:hypothetical protein